MTNLAAGDTSVGSTPSGYAKGRMMSSKRASLVPVPVMQHSWNTQKRKMEYAETENRILVTIDTDFGELIHLQGIRHAGLIRLPDVSAHQRIALMAEIIERHSEALQTRRIVTIRSGRIRISFPPSFL